MTKIKRRLMVSHEIVMCSKELWQTVCQKEQFKEQRDVTEVSTVPYLESQNLWAAPTSGKACSGCYISLPLGQQRIVDFRVNCNTLRDAS